MRVTALWFVSIQPSIETGPPPRLTRLPSIPLASPHHPAGLPCSPLASPHHPAGLPCSPLPSPHHPCPARPSRLRPQPRFSSHPTPASAWHHARFRDPRRICVAA